jgi:dihydroneopterin aldolase
MIKRFVSSATFTRAISGDCLFIKGAAFHGYHGVFKEEHELGQKFVVDLEIYYDRKNKEEDELRIDIMDVYRDVEGIVGSNRENSEELIENLAERIAWKIEETYKDRAHAVRVVIQKPQVALPGILDSSAVEIEHHFG